MDDPAPRPSNGVRLPLRRKTMKLLEEDHGFQMERERKLKREISDHGNHLYTDPPGPYNPFPSLTEQEEWRQQQGVETYKRFADNCAVGKDLDDFRTKGRQLGVPLGLISSAKNIEKQIQVLQYFVWRNAIALYGKSVEEVHRKHPLKIPESFMIKTNDGVYSQSTYTPHDFVNVMDLLADELSNFLDYWINLPKFVDERVGEAATRLYEELEYRVKCFRRNYGGRNADHTGIYRHDLCAILGQQISNFRQALNDFVEIGSSAVQANQEYRRLNLRNMSTIATFFSAVASAMAQLSIPMKETTLEKAVSLLFIASLILSIGAVIQSLWALSWNHASYRAPDEHVPTLIVFWATHSPLVLMVASISSFSAGLVALCYAVLDRTVFWVVFSITVFCATGFFVTAMWSWAEWLVYQRHKGTKWLAGILSAYTEQLWDSPPVEKIKYPGRRFYQYVTAGFKATAVTKREFVTASRNRSRLRRFEKQNAVLPTVVGDEMPSGLSGFLNATKTAIKNATKTAIKNAILDHLSDTSTSSAGWEMDSSDPVMIIDEGASAPWFWGCDPDERPLCLMLKITRAHSDMIKHMQFNPGTNRHNASGFILATHSRGTVRLWDSQNGSSAIQRVHGFADLDTTSLGSGYKRYAWAPDGSRLLTRIDRETEVWSSAGRLETSFSEKWPAGCTVWLSDGSGILSSYRSSVRRLDARGIVQDTWELKRVSWIHDMVESTQGERIVAVGETESRADRHSIAECAIVVFNVRAAEYELVTPLCSRSRTLERLRPHDPTREYYLLSFEEAPPQLWLLDTADSRPRLTWNRTYAASTDHSTFTGPACFGRINDVDLVLIPTPNVIYMLEMLTGNLRHAIRTTLDPDNSITSFTSVAWDHLSPRPRFATGSVDGTVVIWTSEPEHQQRSEAMILGSQLTHKALHGSPTAITFSIPEARAVRGEADQGLGPDASTDERKEMQKSGGSQARELESRREPQD